jgi:hypothetical protein
VDSRAMPRLRTVSIGGVVHRFTDVGTFLYVQARRVFIPASCIFTASNVRGGVNIEIYQDFANVRA